MENLKEKNAVEEVKEPKEKVSMERYEDIEAMVDKAIQSKDYELALALNELTLARNLESNKKFKGAFEVVYVAFKTASGITKRAGVFNTSDFKDAEQAEDILISEDFGNKKVLAVPRNSMFVSSLK